jgi:hypothetical protein
MRIKIETGRLQSPEQFWGKQTRKRLVERRQAGVRVVARVVVRVEVRVVASA